MPNGGTDYCLSCIFNAQRGEKSGHCTIRNLSLGKPELTYCVNQTYHNPRRIETPIGPVVERHYYPPPIVIAKSPDNETIREVLLTLAVGIQEQPLSEYGSPPYFDEMVVWQLGEFREHRALDVLQRIAAFDQSLGFYARNNHRLVTYAEEAILKVLGVETPDPIGRPLYS